MKTLFIACLTIAAVIFGLHQARSTEGKMEKVKSAQSEKTAEAVSPAAVSGARKPILRKWTA